MNDANKAYWEDGTFYNSYVNEEFSDFRKDAWKKQILSHFPESQKLCVLDTGCGPGFFSCILSEEGHSVTGIDRSSGMLRCAKENARRMGVLPQFINMDISEMNFGVDSFDLIVSRNVTWTLENPEEVYKQFYKSLRPGGKLLIYDANWHLPYFRPELLQKVRDNERWYFETYNEDFKVCDESTGFFYDLPLSNTERPQWDIKALCSLGYTEVSSNISVGETLYTDWEKRLYSATPLFEISARKPY